MDTRPVWFTLDELIDLPGVQLRVIAQQRYHAAPADAVTEVRWLLANIERVGAYDVLCALGMPCHD